MCGRLTVIFVLLFTFAFTNAQRGSSCKTPNDESAKCVSIHSCSLLLNAVRTRDPQQVSFLRESQCGYDFEPLVCCGSFDTYQSKRGNRPRPQIDTVSNNRNSNNNVLPDKSQCGVQSTDRILDGQTTALEEFPWMALLQYQSRTGDVSNSCGGTLISSRYVLTAAHCVTGPILTSVGKLVNVRLGEWNTETARDCISQFNIEDCSDDPVDVAVEEVTVHPGYSIPSPNRYNDIALIRLRTPVKFTVYIQPLCLPTKSEPIDSRSRLFVAGWGKTEYSNSSPVKLKLRVPLAAKSQCKSKFRTAGVTVGSNQICAGGEKGRDSCNGDSGGPLMTTLKSDPAVWYIKGIVSFGAKCGIEGWPGVYTDVSEYIDWIQDNVR